MSQKITKTQVRSLYEELERLEEWLSPKPDPSQWPPAGWERHPANPSLLYRVVSEDDLKEELFGSDEKTAWINWAKWRVQQIKDTLATYFFPEPKEEGTERKTKGGFVVMLKTGLERTIDEAAISVVLAECKKAAIARKIPVTFEGEDGVLKYVPKLALKKYRELPEPIKRIFDAALITKPTKTEFEIVPENGTLED